MAMTLRDYFLTRCSNALEAERNIEMLLAGMVEETRHGHLRDMLQQHHQGVQQEVTNLQSIANSKGGTRKRATTTEVREGEQLIIVGRGWIGSVGTEVVETHRSFIANTPEHLIDVNNALLDEDICHFNMGLYTGLIVVAKQLGNTDAANLLQQNIDHENHQRMMLEESLWWIVRDRAEAPSRKAA